MEKNKYITTKTGLNKLIQELEERKGDIRKQIADRIEKATAIGDLSENAAYTAALEDQQMNETKILELEDLVKKAQIKKGARGDTKVDLGEIVTIKEKGGDKEITFTIVSEQEADPLEKKYSLSSPLGSAVFEKKLNDSVTVQLPAGKKVFTIVKIV
ncbi:MAG: transcription elongation factor GreA [bacterium]